MIESLFAELEERRTPGEILAEIVEEYKPVKTFAMFSGGHDSLCSTHVSMETGLVDAVVHINTGIGIPQTRQFVRKTCKAQGWPLLEYHPPKSYEWLVTKFGFPGPGWHYIAYQRLKDRCIEQIMREHRTLRSKEKILFLTGCRKQESKRRMGSARRLAVRGNQIWLGMIFDWLGTDKTEYMERHDLPRNPVVDLLCMSGECLCGAFARPNELQEIEMWYPDVVEHIRQLEAKARDAGVHAKWGVRPPRKSDPMQDDLPLCWSCEAKMEENDGAQKKDLEGKTGQHGHSQGDARTKQG